MSELLRLGENGTRERAALVEVARAAMDPALFDRGSEGAAARQRLASALEPFEPEEIPAAPLHPPGKAWSIILEVETDDVETIRARLSSLLMRYYGVAARTKTIETSHLQIMLKPPEVFQEKRPDGNGNIKSVRRVGA